MLSLTTQADDIAAAYIPPATGRPSHIGDATLLKELFAAIEQGNYLETACDLVGLSYVSVYAWRKRGEAGETPFDAFAKALKAASARAEARAVVNVMKAGESPQFWASNMTYLERRHPEKWGRRNEENTTPKIVVQVGGSDVKVVIGPIINSTFAPLTSTDSLCISASSAHLESNNTELCLLTQGAEQGEAETESGAGLGLGTLPAPLGHRVGLTVSTLQNVEQKKKNKKARRA